jgi:hypothetical protein
MFARRLAKLRGAAMTCAMSSTLSIIRKHRAERKWLEPHVEPLARSSFKLEPSKVLARIALSTEAGFWAFATGFHPRGAYLPGRSALARSQGGSPWSTLQVSRCIRSRP